MHNQQYDTSHSAKQSAQRPVFNSLVEDIKAGTLDAVLTWAPDRLACNAGDLGALGTEDARYKTVSKHYEMAIDELELAIASPTSK